MTYDQVEQILGKPHSIVKGYPTLVDDIKSLPLSQLRRVALDSTVGRGSGWLVTPKKTGYRGELVFVSWIYPQLKADSGYVAYWNSAKKVAFVQIPNPQDRLVYVAQASKTYHAIQQCRNATGKVKTSFLSEVPEGFSPCTACAPPPRTVQKQMLVDDPNRGYRREWYDISNARCIIFNASTGRVNDDRYCPISIEVRK
jgi:hypothetical protein